MMKYGSSSLTLCKMRRCSLLVTSNPTKSPMCFLTPGWPLKRDPLVVVKGVGTRRNGHGRDTARAHHAHEKMKPTAAHSRRTDQNNAFLRTYGRVSEQLSFSDCNHALLRRRYRRRCRPFDGQRLRSAGPQESSQHGGIHARNVERCSAPGVRGGRPSRLISRSTYS